MSENWTTGPRCPKSELVQISDSWCTYTQIYCSIPGSMLNHTAKRLEMLGILLLCEKMVFQICPKTGHKRVHVVECRKRDVWKWENAEIRTLKSVPFSVRSKDQNPNSLTDRNLNALVKNVLCIIYNLLLLKWSRLVKTTPISLSFRFQAVSQIWTVWEWDTTELSEV